MRDFTIIEKKLQQFSRKYYTNELIKGSILFVTLGLVYFLFTLFIEYFLWLKPTSRTFLFWFFIAVEIFLLIRFIGFPLFKLIGLQKGITQIEASKIIGSHFPEVKDKLLNVLQLKSNTSNSDLLIASIEQKSKKLQPIPFNRAVNFKTNLKYVKFLAIPIIIWLITLISGVNKELSESFSRVVNHSENYIPPAPFYFNLVTKDLSVIQGKSLTITFNTTGEVVPSEVKINYNNQQYYLENNGLKSFSYTFPEINDSFDFFVEANGISSDVYNVSIIKTPTVQNIKLHILYPHYVGKKNETISNTGNVIVPQGTIIKWNVKTHQTDSVSFIHKNKKEYFKRFEKNIFNYSKKIVENINYQIATSNSKISAYEKLQFAVNIINDEHPLISVTSNIDSISRGPAHFAGQISDDYGLSKLQLVYYDSKNPENKLLYDLPITKENVQSFFYKFPDGLNLQEGIDYEIFFQVFDNDAVNGRKRAISKQFSYRKKTSIEVEEELLNEQKDYIKTLENSLKKQQKSKKELEKIQFNLQNKKQMNWNDKKKIENIIKRQMQYKQMMQKQTEKLEENFSEKKEQTEQLQNKKEDLKKRIEELKKLEKQEKLFKELMKMTEKLKKDDLINKTKELAEENKQQERSLERILELTKRFYVEQKTTQLSEKLKELAKKQKELASKNSTKEEQDKINKEFENIQKDLKELHKENEALKEPMDIPSMKKMQEDTKKELNKASKNLEQQNPSKAKEKQKKASKMMQKMSSEMEQSMQTMSMEMEEENEKDLRKILENLLIFSFKQENLVNKSNIDNSESTTDFSENLKKQHQLKTYFEHIDDSLFVLSMRSPKISSKIQDQLSIAHYNLDQSLENLSNNNFIQGNSNQRYVMTAANVLADMLSNHLDALKNPKMSSSSKQGKGKKESFSLPDIIQKQSELLKKMKEGMNKKSQQGNPKEGKNGKEKKGDKGKKKGKDGKTGEDGEQMNGELYKIYQEQSRLREELQNALKEGKNGNNSKAKRALQEMEQLENKILEKGFSKENMQRMQQLNYQLLKLDKATFEQGEDNKRKSKTNTKDYSKNKIKELEFKKRFYNQTEILNRQSLPLQQRYKKKVQEYFSVPKTK